MFSHSIIVLLRLQSLHAPLLPGKAGREPKDSKRRIVGGNAKYTFFFWLSASIGQHSVPHFVGLGLPERFLSEEVYVYEEGKEFNHRVTKY